MPHDMGGRDRQILRQQFHIARVNGQGRGGRQAEIGEGIEVLTVMLREGAGIHLQKLPIRCGKAAIEAILQQGWVREGQGDTCRFKGQFYLPGFPIGIASGIKGPVQRRHGQDGVRCNPIGKDTVPIPQTGGGGNHRYAEELMDGQRGDQGDVFIQTVHGVHHRLEVCCDAAAGELVQFLVDRGHQGPQRRIVISRVRRDGNTLNGRLNRGQTGSQMVIYLAQQAHNAAMISSGDILDGGNEIVHRMPVHKIPELRVDLRGLVNDGFQFRT